MEHCINLICHDFNIYKCFIVEPCILLHSFLLRLSKQCQTVFGFPPWNIPQTAWPRKLLKDFLFPPSLVCAADSRKNVYLGLQFGDTVPFTRRGQYWGKNHICPGPASARNWFSSFRKSQERQQGLKNRPKPLVYASGLGSGSWITCWGDAGQAMH